MVHISLAQTQNAVSAQKTRVKLNLGGVSSGLPHLSALFNI